MTGGEVDSTILREMMMDASIHELTFGTLKFCHFPNSGLCAVIDEHGYVLTSNQDKKFTGQFIGEMIGPLVKGFQDKDTRSNRPEDILMSEVLLEDAQAECPELDEPSAANILLTPARLLFGALTAFCKSFYWLVVKVGIVLISLFEFTQRASAQLPLAINVSCTKTMPFYKFDFSKFTGSEDNWMHTGFFTCKDCPNDRRRFKLQWIDGTNTFIVFAETVIKREAKNINCGCYNQKISLKHVRKVSDYNWCDPPKQPFRRPPMACFNDTSQHPDGIKCGSGSITKPSPFMLLLTITISITLLFFVYLN